MNGRDIAGFYFDAEKNKYFKIQPNHSAPAGSPYTRENVKKVRNQKKQEREHNVRRQTLALEKVKRSSVLQSPWCAPKLQREHHGQSNRSRQLESSMLSAGFRHARRLASVSSNITACLRVDDFGGWFIGKLSFYVPKRFPVTVDATLIEALGEFFANRICYTLKDKGRILDSLKLP